MKSVGVLKFVMALLIVGAFNCRPVKGEAKRASDYFDSPSGIAITDAISNGDIPKIVQLVNDGMDVNIRGHYGMTPILWAFYCKNKDAFSCLLTHGANPNLQFERDGNSVVSLAAMLEDSWYLKQALKFGGNPNLLNPATGLPPIFESIKQQRIEDVKLLIAAGANLDFKDKNGQTALMISVLGNRYDIAYALLKAGSDPTIKNKWGNSVLWFMRKIRIDPNSPLFQWKLKVTEVLRSKGVDVDNGN